MPFSLRNTGGNFCRSPQLDAGPDVLVGIDDRLALPRLDRDGGDLVPELAGLLRGLAAAVRLERVLVLLQPVDAVVVHEILGRHAHRLAQDRAGEPVLIVAVQHVDMPEAIALAEARQQERDRRHALHAAGDDHAPVVEQNRGAREIDRLEAAAAGLVDGRRDTALTATRRDRDLARRVGARPELARLPHVAFFDSRGLDPGSRERSADRRGAELDGGER